MESTTRTWARKLWVLLPLLMLTVGQLHLASSIDQFGQNEPLEILKVRRLEVIGRSGRPVVALGQDKEGRGVAVVADSVGNPRASLLGDVVSGTVRVLTGGLLHLETVVTLSADEQGNGTAETRTANGEGVATLAVVDGHPSFFLTNTRTGSLIYFGFHQEEPLIELFGPHQEGASMRLRVKGEQGEVWVWGSGEKRNALLPTSRR